MAGGPATHGLVPIVNASGTMTALGASRAVPEAVEAVAGILAEFVDIAALQARASAAIAAATGAEAGFVTSSAASGITLGVAAAMTGADLAAIARLPEAAGLRAEVVLPAGHCIDFGAPVTQMIRLAGATPVAAGTVLAVDPWQVEAALSERTAAGLYVVSHHVASTGQIGLGRFIAACHARGVPVIVDMAAEYDLTGAISAGADLAIWSAQKFLGGPTAGIVAGRRDLVRAAWLQNRGIGRAMKVGKEGIAGAIAALEAWGRRDHAAVRAREEAIVAGWLAALAGTPGLVAAAAAGLDRQSGRARRDRRRRRGRSLRLGARRSPFSADSLGPGPRRSRRRRGDPSRPLQPRRGRGGRGRRRDPCRGRRRPCAGRRVPPVVGGLARGGARRRPRLAGVTQARKKATVIAKPTATMAARSGAVFLIRRAKRAPR